MHLRATSLPGIHHPIKRATYYTFLAYHHYKNTVLLACMGNRSSQLSLGPRFTDCLNSSNLLFSIITQFQPQSTEHRTVCEWQQN
ncbi:hypothetical protein J4Q44_G00321840 [Coregonus suidteri]|uniref:Uncharacterized protein n=1 Tax=Coregonus suidteri TaxID=861788 RepID=A0AAN8KZY0_9TELE